MECLVSCEGRRSGDENELLLEQASVFWNEETRSTFCTCLKRSFVIQEPVVIVIVIKIIFNQNLRQVCLKKNKHTNKKSFYCPHNKLSFCICPCPSQDFKRYPSNKCPFNPIKYPSRGLSLLSRFINGLRNLNQQPHRLFSCQTLY